MELPLGRKNRDFGQVHTAHVDGEMKVPSRFPFFVAIQGKHYGVPGVNVDGQDMLQMLATGRAVTEYVRSNGPAIMQV